MNKILVVFPTEHELMWFEEKLSKFDNLVLAAENSHPPDADLFNIILCLNTLPSHTWILHCSVAQEPHNYIAIKLFHYLEDLIKYLSSIHNTN